MEPCSPPDFRRTTAGTKAWATSGALSQGGSRGNPLSLSELRAARRAKGHSLAGKPERRWQAEAALPRSPAAALELLRGGIRVLEGEDDWGYCSSDLGSLAIVAGTRIP